MRLLLVCCALALTHPLHGQHGNRIAGLASRPDIFLSEGLTDTAMHPRATGTIKAIMLFARFPDAQDEDRTPQELYDHLVPGAVKFFRDASCGRLELKVDARTQWYSMKGKSTDPGYDGSRHESHKAYVAEVMAAADKDVDFGGCSIVYVVASKNKGTPISPTLHCDKGRGIPADGNEIRHAVTFGNDSRKEKWGWQTLVHETGHILGLPDLYSFDRGGGGYKDVHRFVGGWDPMGYQGHGSDFLVWHKLKCSWLDETDVAVVKEGSVTREVAPSRANQGLKALVVPISESEAYVAEVKHLCAARDAVGVLVYRVSTRVESGKGPIRVLPAIPDDDTGNPDLSRSYIALYNALYFEGGHFEDAAGKVRIDVQKKTASGFQIQVSR
jgi:M6 family metalloprotease-like protein